MFKSVRKLALVSIFLAASVSAAGTESAAVNGAYQAAIKRELSKRYPEARIAISAMRCTGVANDLSAVVLKNMTARGEAQFGFGANAADCWVSYSALVPAHIALKRVMPGESLRPEMFITQDVNVATGTAFEYRGVVLSANHSLSGLETRQTVLEGQFLTSTAVQRMPDVRRGDSVRVHLLSGGLTVSTLGMAQEPGYVNGRVRVTTAKTKREFVGTLSEGGVVEVNL